METELRMKETFLFLCYFVGLCVATDAEGVQLQICTQKDETLDEFIPLNHSKIEAMQHLTDSPNDRMDIDTCVRDNMVKISLVFDTEFDGSDITLCWTRFSMEESPSPACYKLSGLVRTKTNATIACWFQQNVSQKNIVGFSISNVSSTDGTHVAYYGSVKLNNKDMCNESICNRVGPRYGRVFGCGLAYKMELPERFHLLKMALSCATCEDKRGYTFEDNNTKTSSPTVTLQFGKDLQTGSYNLTTLLQMEGFETFCKYRKTITIICEDDQVEVGGSMPSSTESNAKHCKAFPEQCSFSHFVLFGLAVSSIFVMLLCIITCIVVRRKTIARRCSSCYRDSESGVESRQHIPMIPNNAPARRSPVSLHLPKHVNFHRMSDRFMVLLLPIPYDIFTRDTMECLRKVVTLDNRIPSACVYDNSILSQVYANKFNWIDKTLSDIHNIVIFLSFTSLHRQRDPTIVDEVLRMCQAPATRPGCHTILAHVTDSEDDLNEVKFLGSSFKITTKEGYKGFLKTVYGIYGYKPDNEHDRHKLKQIIHCGASKMFLNRLNTCPVQI